MAHMKKIKILIFLLLIITSEILLAQPGPGGNAPCWPPPCVPIDGGLSFFIVLAALFGYKFSFKPKN